MVNIIFDFGAVLVDWNPRYVFKDYFGDPEKCEYFLSAVCNNAWNAELDAGKPFATAVEERIALFPEWEEAIRTYRARWKEMMGDAIPGVTEYVRELKARGYKLYGLTNWCSETFYTIEANYPVFGLLDGKIVSGDVGLLKPSPEIFRCLLDRFLLKASESVFIDDNPVNVLGAEAVGIKALRFTDAAALRRDLEPLLG